MILKILFIYSLFFSDAQTKFNRIKPGKMDEKNVVHYILILTFPLFFNLNFQTVFYNILGFGFQSNYNFSRNFGWWIQREQPFEGIQVLPWQKLFLDWRSFCIQKMVIQWVYNEVWNADFIKVLATGWHRIIVISIHESV